MAEYRHYRPGEGMPCLKSVVAAGILIASSFAISCILINQGLSNTYWRPDLDAIDAKLAAFEPVKQDFDLLWFGSSHVIYGVDPELLDEVLRSNGIEIRSFNLAFEGMTVAERGFMLTRALEQSGGKAKYVAIELELRATPSLTNLLAARTRYFSSSNFIFQPLMAKLMSGRPVLDRAISSSVISISFLINQLNLGVLPDIFLPRPIETSDDGMDTKNNDETFSDVGWKSGSSRVARRNLPAITRSIASASKKTSTQRKLTDAEFATLERDLKTIEDCGCIPIVVFPPSCVGLEEDYAIRNSIQTRRPDILVLDFTPGGSDWKSFCDPELWFDQGHLAAGGAEVLSQLLGDRLSSSKIWTDRDDSSPQE